MEKSSPGMCSVTLCACVRVYMCPYLYRRDVCVWRVTVHGVHGGQVLIAHVKHLGAFTVSQVGGAMLQGRSLFILIPIFLQREKEGSQKPFCVMFACTFMVIKVMNTLRE